MYEPEATLMLLKTERSQQNVDSLKGKVAYEVMTPTGGAVAGGSFQCLLGFCPTSNRSFISKVDFIYSNLTHKFKR